MNRNFDLNTVNIRAAEDPEALIAEYEERYRSNVLRAASAVAARLERSHIVLLSGPSGSGKTTTAHKLEARLERMGIVSHTISMDDYYRDVDPLTSPRDERGEYDFESPDCLDLPLLLEHFRALSEGEEVRLPKFDFAAQKRSEEYETLHLGANEIVIFEGIHALNPMLASRGEGARATRLYISARSNYLEDAAPVFMGTWTRIIRRAVRDRQFRGAEPKVTFAMWESVRKGERSYISPYKNTADVIFNTSHAYEVGLLRGFCDGLFDNLDPSALRYAEVCALQRALERFEPVDRKLIPDDSLLREFIGN